MPLVTTRASVAYGAGFGKILGGGSGDTGVMYPISSINLSALTTTVTFSNIPQTFTHLQVICMTRISRTANDPSSNQLYFNNDTGSNYNYHGMYSEGNAVSPTSFGVASTSTMYIGTNASDGTAAGTFAPMIIDILDYKDTNKFKSCRAITGFSQNTTTSGNRAMAIRSGLWRSTSAITSMSFTPNVNQYMAGSTFTLYGIKGA